MGKDVKESKDLDIAGKGTASLAVPTRINSEEDARILLASFEVPKDVTTVIVTEDRNVFYPENRDFALNHAFKNNLKTFEIAWQQV